MCAFGVCSCVSLLQTNRLFYRIYLLTSKFDPLVVGEVSFCFVSVGEARRGVLKRKRKKDSEKKKKREEEKERKKSRNLEEEKGVHTSK